MFLAMLHSLWDLSSPSRDQTSVPAVKVQSLNLWTTMEFPLGVFDSYVLFPKTRMYFMAGIEGLQLTLKDI